MKTTATTFPRPLVPEDLPADKILVRSVTARAVAAARGRGVRPELVAREFWPRDAATSAFIERAAISGATTTASGWAVDLMAKAVSAFLGSLSDNAAGALIGAAPQFNIPGYSTIALPRATSNTAPQWVGEGSPIAAGQAVIAGPVLGPPKKLGLIESCSRELSRVSPEAAENIIATILRDSVARQLDASLFSATASDATRPAGILAGISAAGTATTGGGLNAVLTDLRLLVDAVENGGGSGNVLFFTSAGRALALLGYVPALAGRVFGSASIASGTLIAIDPNGFASMFGTEPEVVVSLEGLIHFEDTTPLQIATGVQGSGVLATPTREAFQTDMLLIRVILWAAWVMRVPGAVSFISTGLSW